MGETATIFLTRIVRFDGIDSTGRTLLEAKGPGYAWAVKNGEFRSWFTGKEAIVDQAKRQVAAAKGAPIVWHVAEETAADAIRNALSEFNIKGIDVVHTPAAP